MLHALRERRSKLSAYVRYLQSVWDEADADGSGTLTESEVIELVSKVNIHRSRRDIKKLYREVDSDGSGTLNFVEFCKLMKILQQR